MDILDVIKNRTSYRGKYKSTPVPKDDLIKILEAGAAAPSGCNKQTTSFIAVDDEKLLGELKSLIVPPIAETAPCFILVLQCAGLQCGYRKYAAGGQGSWV